MYVVKTKQNKRKLTSDSPAINPTNRNATIIGPMAFVHSVHSRWTFKQQTQNLHNTGFWFSFSSSSSWFCFCFGYYQHSAKEAQVFFRTARSFTYFLSSVIGLCLQTALVLEVLESFTWVLERKKKSYMLSSRLMLICLRKIPVYIYP